MGETIEALLLDPMWQWGRSGAEDIVRAVWKNVDLDQSGDVDKREFVLQGGLAEQLKNLLSSNFSSVDEWIMENQPSE